MSEKKERNKMIAIKVLNGASLSKVGKEYNISSGRVKQVFFRTCLHAVRKNRVRDKLPEKWFFVREARKHKDLLIDAIQRY